MESQDGSDERLTNPIRRRVELTPTGLEVFKLFVE